MTIITSHNAAGFDGSEVLASCIYTGRTTKVPASAVVTVTSRSPRNELFNELQARGETLRSAAIVQFACIGDALALSTIAAAVFAGHRFAREHDVPPSDEAPFKREHPLYIDASTGEYELHADWVVAADGGRSTLRRLLEQRLDGRSYSGRFIICDIKATIDLPTERLCYFEPPWNPGSNVLVHRLPDSIWRIDLKLSDGESPEEALQTARVTQRIESVLEMIGQPVRWELDWAAVYSANTLTLPDYRVGSVLFVGDAAHLLPIFGVRGLNTGMQDANNLAWKLALVVRGLAPSSLLGTYSGERVRAAREICTEAGRSTRFMSPQTEGSRLLRNAVLSFSLSQTFANDLLHWRTSRPHDYAASPLNTITDDDAGFAGGISCGQPIRNVELGEGSFLFDRLSGTSGFHLLIFADDATLTAELRDLLEAMPSCSVPVVRVLIRRGPAGDQLPADVQVVDPAEHAREKYGARPGTIYLVRPDFHVCARWLEPTLAGVQEAILKATRGESPNAQGPHTAEAESTGPTAGPERRLERGVPVHDLETIYDAIAEAVDVVPRGKTTLMLTKLSLALANLLGDRAQVEQALRASVADLQNSALS